MENENNKDILPQEDTSLSAEDIIKDILAATGISPDEVAPVEFDALVDKIVSAEVPAEADAPAEAEAKVSAEAAVSTETEITSDSAPAVSDLDARVEAQMASIEASQSLPDIETGLEGDAEFQEALEALKAFSARYGGKTGTPTEDATPVENTAPEKVLPQPPVTEHTVSFDHPVSAPAENMESTQKFDPVAESADKETPQPAPVRKKPPVRKGRPSAKTGYGLFGLPHVISTGIWLAIILAIGISLGRILWVCAADLLAFGKPDKPFTITVEETDTIETIADKLSHAGVVRYKNLFIQFAKITGKGEDVLPGTYTLNAKYDYNALLKMMSFVPVNTESVTILIPEGYNCAQVFRLLEEKGVCSVADLEEWAANGELNEYWFLEGVPRGTKYCLEGYLYPDTYQFYKNDEPRRVLQKFLNCFDYRFTEKMYNDFMSMQNRFDTMLKNNGYGEAYREANKLTFHKLITMASIVEEEKATSAEGYDIAAVFYNRLAKAASYPRLDSDATVHYAIGSYLERHELTATDLDVDSPYNTRKYGGLPPGPITNPGSFSLYAALYPSETAYYYFIYDAGMGFHRFSKTLEEHENWVNLLKQQS